MDLQLFMQNEVQFKITIWFGLGYIFWRWNSPVGRAAEQNIFTHILYNVKYDFTWNLEFWIVLIYFLFSFIK